MIIRSVRRAPRASVLLALVLWLCVAPAPRAAEDDSPTADGWRKVFAYARCSFSVFKAVTPTDWAAAFFDCGKTLMDEPAPGAQP